MNKSIVIISRAGTGIGKGIAEAFAQDGYRVIATDVLVDEGIAVVSALQGTGAGEHILYSAAKAGLLGLVRGVAIELAKDGVRANCIAPGFIRTAQTLDPVNSVGEEGLNAIAQNVPLGRIGDPSDIADVATFLASDKARYITGPTIAVDGGVLIVL